MPDSAQNTDEDAPADRMVIDSVELHMLAAAYRDTTPGAFKPSTTAYQAARAEFFTDLAHDSYIEFVPSYLHEAFHDSKPWGSNDALIYMSPPEMRDLAASHEERAKQLVHTGSGEDQELHDLLQDRASELRRWAKTADKGRVAPKRKPGVQQQADMENPFGGTPKSDPSGGYPHDEDVLLGHLLVEMKPGCLPERLKPEMFASRANQLIYRRLQLFDEGKHPPSAFFLSSIADGDFGYDDDNFVELSRRLGTSGGIATYLRGLVEMAGARSSTPVEECTDRVLDLYVRRQLIAVGVKAHDAAVEAVGNAFQADTTFEKIGRGRAAQFAFVLMKLAVEAQELAHTPERPEPAVPTADLDEEIPF